MLPGLAPTLEPALLPSPAAQDAVVVVLRPSLEYVLRCPSCQQPHHADEMEGAASRTVMRCRRRECRNVRWWVMLLEEGSVETQLTWAFESAEHAQFLMRTYHLPAALERPMYWQLPLTPHQHYRHFSSPTNGKRSKPRELFHALGLLKGII